jgi:tRNA(adenine34) deaminase
MSSNAANPRKQGIPLPGEGPGVGPCMTGLSDQDTHRLHMKDALAIAAEGATAGEVPIGAIVVGPDGEILARAHNGKESFEDPTAHAEILAIREAARLLGTWRLLDCTLYTTLEPCPMCAGAILQARMARVVIAAPDLKWGASRTKLNLFVENLFNHNVDVLWLSDDGADVACQESSVALLQSFFQKKRKPVG